MIISGLEANKMHLKTHRFEQSGGSLNAFYCKTKRWVFKCILLASKPLIIMQIPHNFIKHLIFK